MDNSVAIQLQAMQLDYARELIAQAQFDQPPAASDPGAAAVQPVPDAILDLSAAAQALLS